MKAIQIIQQFSSTAHRAITMVSDSLCGDVMLWENVTGLSYNNEPKQDTVWG